MEESVPWMVAPENSVLDWSQIIWEIVEFHETNGFCSERKEKWAVSNCTNKSGVIFLTKPSDDAKSSTSLK